MHRLALIKRQAGLARETLLFCAAVAALAFLVVSLDLITFNSSPSAPIGLYRAAHPDRATYVSFCLNEQHRGQAFYARACNPDQPKGTPLIKRIGPNGDDTFIEVISTHPKGLDSKLLGYIPAADILNFWVPLWTSGRAS